MKKACFYIALCGILWSGFEVATKFIAGQFNPIQFTFSRELLGGLVLLPLTFRELKRRGLAVNGKMIRRLLPLSFFGQALNLTFNQLAIIYAPATAVSSIACCNPIFVAFFVWLFLREQLTQNKIISLAAAVIGIVFIVAPWNLEISIIGVLLAVMTPVFFSISSVFTRKVSTEYGGIVVTSICLLLGSMELIGFSMLTHIPPVGRIFSSLGWDIFTGIPFFEGYTWETLPYVFYTYVISTGFGFCCYYVAMEKSNATYASLAFFLKPVISPIYAYFLLGEITAVHSLIGGAILILALAIFLIPDLLKEHRTSFKNQASF